MKNISINILKYSAYILSSIIMILTFLFIPAIATPMATTYLIIITVFLGVNLASTLKTTNALSEGSYKPIKLYRYILTIVMTIIIFCVGAYIQNIKGIELNGALSSIGTTALTIIALFIGEAEGNKLLVFSNSGLVKKYEEDIGAGDDFKPEDNNHGFSYHTDITIGQ